MDVEDVVEQNSGVRVVQVQFSLEDGQAAVTCEFPGDARGGLSLAKVLIVDFDDEEFGGAGFDLFRLASELASEVDAALKRRPS